ncbi:hypothetical protein [Methanoculleus sp.]|uniref:hypothetical protein n=1 Tax=Methanoculleus sp. TaxID=90427 RepID=UPI0025CDE42E|nr:hypothetical protein [Methanoculleus sp.]MCK9319056.1 hypothetical protein [Methanoculleus sp.]
MKLKKNYSWEELKGLQENGAKLERDYMMDTHAIASQGLIIRYGIKINNIQYQAIYSSGGYARRITQDVKMLNENRLHEKHYFYEEKARKHFDEKIGVLL